jgi:hypothetical protein
MQSLHLGLQSLNHNDLSLKIKTALKCISAAVEGIALELQAGYHHHHDHEKRGRLASTTDPEREIATKR